MCTHFLKSRDPVTGLLTCHFCRGLPQKETILCLTCRARTEIIEETHKGYRCAKCRTVTPFNIAFKQDAS